MTPATAGFFLAYMYTTNLLPPKQPIPHFRIFKENQYLI